MLFVHTAAQPLQPTRFRKRHIALALGTLLASAMVPAVAADGVFELGAIEVRGRTVAAEDSPAAELSINQRTMQRDNADTVGTAVSSLPGASLSRNSRNEDTVYLRGFDSRQVPLFVDGVPLYVPYDGYVDFARFSTFDLAEIRVAKACA